MKTIKNIILTTLFSASLLSVAGLVSAADASLNVLPASSTLTPGQNITASAFIATTGNKVCVVKGTISFNNLTCQSITVANGLTTQTLPTCQSPNFTIGIPKCTSTDMTLFTISADAGSGGSTASINLTNVNIIGVGVSVGSTANGGNYTIAVATTPAPASVSKPNAKPVSKNTPQAQQSPETTKTTTNNLQRAGLASLLSSIDFRNNRMVSILILLLVIIASGIVLVVRKMRKTTDKS